MEKLIAHRVHVSDIDGSAKPRDSVGGFAVLPKQVSYPQCGCGERMALFLQFDIRPEFGLPFAPNCHLLVFQCPAHNGVPRNSWGGWGQMCNAAQLPPQYWLGTDAPSPEGYEASYLLMLNPPTDAESVHPKDPFVKHQELSFEPFEEECRDNSENRVVVQAVGRDGYPGVAVSPWDNEHGYGYRGHECFKIGGQPIFQQKTERRICSCGANMTLICLIPDPMDIFKLAADAPMDFGDSLFISLFTQIIGCEAQCSRLALHAEGQR